MPFVGFLFIDISRTNKTRSLMRNEFAKCWPFGTNTYVFVHACSFSKHFVYHFSSCAQFDSNAFYVVIMDVKWPRDILAQIESFAACTKTQMKLIFKLNKMTEYKKKRLKMKMCWFCSVQGYTKPREYVVTEWPLKHTVGEFWSLVYDQECSAVVVLCQPPPNSVSIFSCFAIYFRQANYYCCHLSVSCVHFSWDDKFYASNSDFISKFSSFLLTLFFLQQSYPAFWPEKTKMEKYGPVFSVHLVSRKHYTNIKQWEFKINKKVCNQINDFDRSTTVLAYR